MGLSEKIKRKAATEVQTDKQEALIRKNMTSATAVLISRFLSKVQNGEVEIQDIRDLKDVASIYKDFTDIDKILESANSGAPQVSLQINNVLNKSLGTKDIIDEDSGEIEKIDISGDLENLSAEDVAKMASDRDKAKNAENEKQW